MKRQAIHILQKLFSESRLIQMTNERILLPFYHLVSDQPQPHIRHLYQSRNVKQFIQDLDFLCRHFEPISIARLKEIKSKKIAVNKPVFHLSFDDGLREIKDVVAPLLLEHGIPATFFVNSAFIDNRDLFFRYKVSLIIDKIKDHPTDIALIEDLIPNISVANFKQKLLRLKYQDIALIDRIATCLKISFKDFLENNQPYLTSEDLKELQSQGFTIGAHSVDHPLFKDISSDEQRNQVLLCFETLHKDISIANKYFSFPFSDDGINKSFIHWLHIEAQCDLTFGVSGLKYDCHEHHLHRIPMEGTDKSAQDIIKHAYLYFWLKSSLNKNKINRT